MSLFRGFPVRLITQRYKNIFPACAVNIAILRCDFCLRTHTNSISHAYQFVSIVNVTGPCDLFPPPPRYTLLGIPPPPPKKKRKRLFHKYINY